MSIKLVFLDVAKVNKFSIPTTKVVDFILLKLQILPFVCCKCTNDWKIACK